MNRLLVFTMVVYSLPTLVWPLTADEFDCEVRHLSFSGEVRFSAAARLVGIREPARSLEVSKSTSELGFQTTDAGSEYGLHLSYSHAKRIEKSLESTKARAVQFLCLQGRYQKEGQPAQSSICLNPAPDPFAVLALGWHQVAVEESIPVFDSDLLNPSVLRLKNGDVVEFRCEHRRTVFES